MKINEKLRKAISICLIFQVVIFLMNGNSVGDAKLIFAKNNQEVSEVKNENSEKQKSYIVATKTKQKMNEIKKDMESSETIISVSDDYMEKEKMVAVQGSEKEVSKLSKEKEVLFVEEDAYVKAFSTKIKNRKVIQKRKNKLVEWNVRAIKAEDRKKTLGEERVKIAILDSGVDMCNDIELKGIINLVPGEEEVLPLYWDVTGHGSSVAGIIAAQDNGKGITGINPNVEIYAAKILDDDNTAPISRVVEGIYWAIEQKVDIINISFGTAVNSMALEKAIKDAYNEGILIIAAAGNTGENVEYPAAYDEVMGVGSVGTDSIVSDYSAKGESVEVVAPGEQILSTGGFGGTVICGGTSMAVPHVTAVASILWQKDKSVSNEFIRQLIDVSANGYGNECDYGNGLVDLDKALENYDKFKKQFSENESFSTNKKGIKENTDSILQFTDVDYVEGLWCLEEHKESVGISKRRKQGAIYPDKSKYLKGITNHPEFHGKANYVSGTIYLAMLAERGQLLTHEQLGMYLSNYSQTQLEHLYSMYIDLLNCQNDPNNVADDKNKNDEYKNITFSLESVFLQGIAIHCATDAYAHSAYMWDDDMDCYRKLTHTDASGTNLTEADNPFVSRSRWESATETAQKMLICFSDESSETSVTYDVFLHDKYYAYKDYESIPWEYCYYGQPFKLYYLSQYARNTTSYMFSSHGKKLGDVSYYPYMANTNPTK